MRFDKFIIRASLAVILLGFALGFALPVLAGNVYDRDTVALGAATGTGTWTNSFRYSAVKLVRIWAIDDLGTTSTITVTRVTSDSTYTQAVGSIVCSGGAGNTATFTAAYLAYGDKLAFSCDNTTGATMMVEFEVQQH